MSDIAKTEYNYDVALTVAEILQNSYAEQRSGLYLTTDPCYVLARSLNCSLHGLTVYQVPTATLLAGQLILTSLTALAPKYNYLQVIADSEL